MPIHRRASLPRATRAVPARETPRPGGPAAVPPVEGIGPEDAHGLQASLGNQAVSGLVARQATGDAPHGAPAEHFARATSGAGHEVPYREEMEATFGRDFSGVEAHLGQRREMKAIGARAAARGNRVAFADARPTPETVAHELTHVVQQEGTGSGVAALAEVSSPSSGAEREADAVAGTVAAGGQVSVRASPDAPGTIQRWWDDEEDYDEAAAEGNDWNEDESYEGGEEGSGPGEEPSYEEDAPEEPAWDEEYDEDGTCEEEEAYEEGEEQEEEASEDESGGEGAEEAPASIDLRSDLLPQWDVINAELDTVVAGIQTLEKIARPDKGRYDPRLEALIEHKTSAAIESGGVHVALTRDLEPGEQPDIDALQARLDALDADVMDLMAEYQYFEPYVEERRQGDVRAEAAEVRAVAAAIASLQPEVDGAQSALAQAKASLASLQEAYENEAIAQVFQQVLSAVDLALNLEPTGIASAAFTAANLAFSDGPGELDAASASGDLADVIGNLGKVSSKAVEFGLKANSVTGKCLDAYGAYNNLMASKEKMVGLQQKLAERTRAVQSAGERLAGLVSQVAAKVDAARAACERAQAKRDSWEETVETF